MVPFLIDKRFYIFNFFHKNMFNVLILPMFFCVLGPKECMLFEDYFLQNCKE